ncbi:MAG TPA: SRPBCC domain-containing protein [Patescibacteria group bacterium]
MNDLTAHVSTEINAPIEKVWDALTKPELVKQYFFGVDLVTDWVEGSDIIYKGEWEGVPFEEKGTVLKVDKPTQLVSNYWSPSYGLPDTIENRQVITYDLEENDGKTTVSISQEGSKTKEAKEHSEANWKLVLDGMKELLEK